MRMKVSKIPALLSFHQILLFLAGLFLPEVKIKHEFLMQQFCFFTALLKSNMLIRNHFNAVKFVSV